MHKKGKLKGIRVGSVFFIFFYFVSFMSAASHTSPSFLPAEFLFTTRNWWKKTILKDLDNKNINSWENLNFCFRVLQSYRAQSCGPKIICMFAESIEFIFYLQEKNKPKKKTGTEHFHKMEFRSVGIYGACFNNSNVLPSLDIRSI